MLQAVIRNGNIEWSSPCKVGFVLERLSKFESLTCLRRNATNPSISMFYASRMRTESVQRDIVNAILRAKSEDDSKTAHTISTEFSTHPVHSAFWGLGVVDVHEKLTHEKLHNSSLGVTKLVLKTIELYIKRVFTKKGVAGWKHITAQLNRRLKDMNK